MRAPYSKRPSSSVRSLANGSQTICELLTLTQAHQIPPCPCRSCLFTHAVSAATSGATPNGYHNGNGNGNGAGHSNGNGNGNGQISSSVLNPHLLALLNQVATGAVQPDAAALQLRELSSGYQQVTPPHDLSLLSVLCATLRPE